MARTPACTRRTEDEPRRGQHRITLINNEFGINQKFVVDKSDATEKVIKDFSDRLPK